MSHLKPRKPRPLGSLRQLTKNNSEKLPSIPRLLPEISGSERLQGGIHGNAMTVPPPAPEKEVIRSSSRPVTDDRPKSKQIPPKSSASSGSGVSHESCEKEIKDGLEREKTLKDQVAGLQKQISELKIALRGKSDENSSLQDQLVKQENEFLSELGQERDRHEETRTTLHTAEEQLTQLQHNIENMTEQHRQDLLSCRTELEKQLADTVAAKDAEIADKDTKLSRLKSQMADALKGNSWERQQQLEELTKELSRVQEECDALRMKIKSIAKNKQAGQGACLNCEEHSSKVTKLQSQLKQRDGTIHELKTLCSKFETQLSTQDKLLEQWAASQGHKIIAPK